MSTETGKVSKSKFSSPKPVAPKVEAPKEPELEGFALEFARFLKFNKKGNFLFAKFVAGSLGLKVGEQSTTDKVSEISKGLSK